MLTTAQVIERVSDRRIIYVGEYHDRFSHHSTQLAIIEGLHAIHPKLAIGMEMFQRPFQKVIDDYIASRIDEREFLRQTEYFQRWGFDYSLYKPILDFARHNQIPVIALNAPSGIVSKVAHEGLDALSDAERRQIPDQMDFNDAAYRNRLMHVFEGHGGMTLRRFEHFLQAQTVWDETMGQTIADFASTHPEHSIVVLAGKEHIAFGSGIPSRAFRRSSIPYATILLDAEPEADIADFILYPPDETGSPSASMMVSLSEKDGIVRIQHMPEDSTAAKAGLTTGDVIVSIDGSPIRTTAEARLVLFYHKPGDTVTILVRRKWLFSFERELIFSVLLR